MINKNVKAAINEVLEGRGESILKDFNPELHLRNDIGLDSFDLAELTVRIEEKTGVDIFKNSIVETLGQIELLLPK